MKRRVATSWRKLIAAVSIGAFALAANAGAQTWQASDGGPRIETGRGGVAPLAANNGYISVGHTESFGPAPQNPHVYVVKTNPAGVIIWANAYDFGGNDYGHDIQECANGDYVITGVTNATGSNALFVMRIAAGGGFIWARLFDRTWEDWGADVLEAANGDIVAAGWSYPLTPGSQDGLIVRFTGAGVPVWAHTFAPVNGGANDWLRGLHETTNGDLVAAGGTTSFGGGNQGWLLRVNGGGIPLWSRHSGNGANEEFNTVIEQTVGANNGNIVAVGSTTGVPGDPLDFYVVKYTGAGVFVAPDISGGSPNGQENVFQIREMANGNLILAGYMNPGPLGAEDGYVIQMTANWNCPAGKVWTMAYGGQGNDRLYSGEEDLVNCFPGFIFCGHTASPGLVPLNDPQQHYLIRTNNVGQAGCNEKNPADRCTWPNYAQNVAQIVRTQYNTGTINAAVYGALGGTVLCYTPCPPPVKNNLSKDGIDGLGSLLSATAFPNPVAAGSSFQLQYMLGSGSEVTVTVSDMSGRIVLDRTEQTTNGSGTMSIGTEGWPAGTYLVKVDLGTETQTKRIVVR